jgi:hypothetical protein
MAGCRAHLLDNFGQKIDLRRSLRCRAQTPVSWVEKMIRRLDSPFLKFDLRTGRIRSSFRASFGRPADGCY